MARQAAVRSSDAVASAGSCERATQISASPSFSFMPMARRASRALRTASAAWAGDAVSRTRVWHVVFATSTSEGEGDEVAGGSGHQVETSGPSSSFPDAFNQRSPVETVPPIRSHPSWRSA